MLMLSWVWAVGRLLGLSTTAGIRASLTLAVIGLLGREGWGIHLAAGFQWLASWMIIVLFIVLAIVEGSFDKVPTFDRIQNRLLMPWRLAAGAIAGGAVMAHGTPGLVIGLVGGGALAYLGMYVKFGIRPRSTTSGAAVGLISLTEDLVAFAAAVLTGLLAPLGYVFFAWTLWLLDRLLHRRSAKYKGLRVLR
jgi:uncharacterized membrane protein